MLKFGIHRKSHQQKSLYESLLNISATIELIVLNSACAKIHTGHLTVFHESADGMNSHVRMCHVNAPTTIDLLYLGNDWTDHIQIDVCLETDS